MKLFNLNRAKQVLHPIPLTNEILLVLTTANNLWQFTISALPQSWQTNACQ